MDGGCQDLIHQMCWVDGCKFGVRGGICCWGGNVCGWPIWLNTSTRSCIALVPKLVSGGGRGLKGDRGLSSGDGESGESLDPNKSL